MANIKEKLVKVGDCVWEVPVGFRRDMRVPARVYASQKMLTQISQDRSLEQLVNVTTLAGIVGRALVMPDAHEGYGFPIGGVAATRFDQGVISPGGIGYDINCGVRLLLTDWGWEEVKPKLEVLAKELNKAIPSGVGRGGFWRLSRQELDQVLAEGIEWAVKNGYALEIDKEFIESGGRLREANPTAVSDKAKSRGRDQLGTLGAGNHFIEVDRVSRIFSPELALKFGLSLNQVVVLIHTGSRGLGHQVATDYIRVMMRVMDKYNIRVPDRELVGVPLRAPEGRQYFAAMSAAANFAWVNRQLITWLVRKVWQKVFGQNNLALLYDLAHNIAKIEEHEIEGERLKVLVHRKGATRCFGPEQEEVPVKYRAFGQPVIIPGSMGTASYVLAGTGKAMVETFGSTCHGAGRVMSRQAAKKRISLEKLKKELAEKSIYYQAGSVRGLLEEAPEVYKDIDKVVEVVSRVGIAVKVAQLKPLVVVKG